MKQNVLFLCTGNSCQSQMAEGLLRKFSGDKYNVYSAGVSPTKVNEYAIKVMDEIGIDISHQKAKPISALSDKSFDIIITVCDKARQNCPAIPNSDSILERIHWDVVNPAEGIDTQENLLKVFREVRDELQGKIKTKFF